MNIKMFELQDRTDTFDDLFPTGVVRAERIYTHHYWCDRVEKLALILIDAEAQKKVKEKFLKATGYMNAKRRATYFVELYEEAVYPQGAKE